MARAKTLLKALSALWGRPVAEDGTGLHPNIPPDPSQVNGGYPKAPAVAWPKDLSALLVADDEPGTVPATDAPRAQGPMVPPATVAPVVPPEVAPLTGRAGVQLYLDESPLPSSPSAALRALADLYLHAARYRTRHIVLAWPACPQTAAPAHVLATLERWQDRDKQGVRGLLFPVKTNAFHVLNHIHLEREAVLAHARCLWEEVRSGDRSNLVRGMPDKDPYLFALANLKPEVKEQFNPTAGELLPHFLACPGFKAWDSCETQLLAHLKAKLERRRQARALGANCAAIGDPSRAPDALFAIDGRLTENEIRRALQLLKGHGAPEVVLFIANRRVRESFMGWRSRLAKVCLQVEDLFSPNPPGIIVLTDQPRVAFDLRQELVERNKQRDKARQWNAAREYVIRGIACPIGDEGLLAPGASEPELPVPREFDVAIVDADAAKTINRLWSAAHKTNGGAEHAEPVREAAAFLARLASLPCGLAQLTGHLSSHDYTDRTRQGFDWMVHEGALREFDKSGACIEGRAHLVEGISLGRALVEKYDKATPFAHLVATHAARAIKGEQVVIVFASAFHRYLAGEFLAAYEQFPGEAGFESFQDRVALITCTQLEDALANLDRGSLVFAGLNDEALRVLMTDNRVPAHTTVLLAQSPAQFLRANLVKIRENFPAFNRYAPRIDSILRQLKDLPESKAPLGTSLQPPPFQMELSSEVHDGREFDPDRCWAVHLEDGSVQFRIDGEHLVHVYDPVSHRATDRGFKPCKVSSLEPGNKLFIMTPELREMIEATGLSLQSDKIYEKMLRDYHEHVMKALNANFPGPSLAAKVRALRAEMARLNPDLAKEMPREETTRHWINLGASSTTEFEKLRPQAPGKEAHFKVFAQALGIPDLEASVYWQRGIQQVRNRRRVDSRYLGDAYGHLLLQPESAIVSANLTRRTVQALFDKARESVIVVTNVEPPKKAPA